MGIVSYSFINKKKYIFYIFFYYYLFKSLNLLKYYILQSTKFSVSTTSDFFFLFRPSIHLTNHTTFFILVSACDKL